MCPVVYQPGSDKTQTNIPVIWIEFSNETRGSYVLSFFTFEIIFLYMRAFLCAAFATGPHLSRELLQVENSRL